MNASLCFAEEVDIYAVIEGLFEVGHGTYVVYGYQSLVALIVLDINNCGLHHVSGEYA